MDWTIQELLGDEQEQERLAIEKYTNNLRVAIPGIIQQFNRDNQTATIQPVIKEQINGEWLFLPLLLDVPVQFPRAGGYCVTFPVRKGDECLVIFNDMCIDSWWQSGEVQTQLEKRRHDLSDAVAILGITSVPKAVKDFSSDSMQIRNDYGETVINIKDGNIDINCQKINIFGDVEIYGNFNAVTEWRVTYYADDRTSGAVPEDEKVYYPPPGNNIVSVKFSPEPQREDYEFVGWSFEPNSQNADFPKSQGGQTFEIDRNTYLYATWRKLR